MNPKPQKILIVLHGSIGDVARALPLANLIRRGYPKATIAWSIEPPAYPLVERHSAVDQVILFDRARWWKNIFSFLRAIRSARFDFVLDLQRTVKSGFISRWSGAPDRVGFDPHDSKEFNWLFNNHYIPRTGETVSKLNQYLQFGELLALKTNSIEWKIELSESERRAVDRMLGSVGDPFAAFFVGSRWGSKKWFPEQTARAAEEVRRRFGLEVVLLGGGGDVRFAEEVVRCAGRPLINFVGKTSLREAIGVLSRARVSVGPDTGLMHLSAAVGTPVVSLWGATSPSRTGPYGYDHLIVQGIAACSPCYLKRCPIGRVCMRSIDVESVAAKVEEALSNGKQRRGLEI